MIRQKMSELENINDFPEDNNRYFAVQSQAELEQYNRNNVETNIKLLGDINVIGEVIQLLAYIRNGIKNGYTGTIQIKLGNTVANPVFMMQVNGQEVPDLTIQDKVQIN